MTKNKFQLKREATYQQLLEAGLLCFSEKGYAATTIEEVSARTGHTKGAFYVHFESKEQLLLRVLNYQFELTRGWTDIPKAYSPEEKSLREVLAITLGRLGEMLKGIDNWIVVLVDFYQSTKRNPDIQAQLKLKYKEWVAGIEELVLTLQDRGWIAPDRNTRSIAKQVIAFNEGYTIFTVLFDGGDPDVLLDGLVKLMA